MVNIVSTKHAEYLEQAAFCRDMAERSASPERKTEWLRLAKLWHSLSEQSATAPERQDPVLQAIIKSSSDKGTE
jgi:hypothetical protein